MATMKSVQTCEKNTIDVVDLERPVPGPKDALVRIRACGICGTDVRFLHMGAIPFGPGNRRVRISRVRSGQAIQCVQRVSASRSRRGTTRASCRSSLTPPARPPRRETELAAGSERHGGCRGG